VQASAIMSHSEINMSDFELLLREQTIREWKDLDQIHPHDAHVFSRVMTQYSLLSVPRSSQTQTLWSQLECRAPPAATAQRPS